MKTRAALVALALVVAAAPLATAKDDASSLRAKVSGEMRAKKHYPFADMKFYLDFPKLQDQRWQVAEVKPLDAADAQGVVFDATLDGAASTPVVHVVIQRWPAYKDEKGKRTPYTLEFKSWGANVPVTDWAKICLGFYEEWTRTASDVEKDKCVVPVREEIGPSKIDGHAVGRDKDSKKRERRDWYCWQTNGAGPPLTYVAQFVTSEPCVDKPEWAVKVVDFVKNIRPVDGK